MKILITTIIALALYCSANAQSKKKPTPFKVGPMERSWGIYSSAGDTTNQLLKFASGPFEQLAYMRYGSDTLEITSEKVRYIKMPDGKVYKIVRLTIFNQQEINHP